MEGSSEVSILNALPVWWGISGRLEFKCLLVSCKLPQLFSLQFPSSYSLARNWPSWPCRVSSTYRLILSWTLRVLLCRFLELSLCVFWCPAPQIPASSDSLTNCLYLFTSARPPVSARVPCSCAAAHNVPPGRKLRWNRGRLICFPSLLTAPAAD